MKREVTHYVYYSTVQERNGRCQERCHSTSSAGHSSELFRHHDGSGRVSRRVAAGRRSLPSSGFDWGRSLCGHGGGLPAPFPPVLHEDRFPTQGGGGGTHPSRSLAPLLTRSPDVGATLRPLGTLYPSRSRWAACF